MSAPPPAAASSSKSKKRKSDHDENGISHNAAIQPQHASNQHHSNDMLDDTHIDQTETDANHAKKHKSNLVPTAAATAVVANAASASSGEGASAEAVAASSADLRTLEGIKQELIALGCKEIPWDDVEIVSKEIRDYDGKLKSTGEKIKVAGVYVFGNRFDLQHAIRTVKVLKYLNAYEGMFLKLIGFSFRGLDGGFLTFRMVVRHFKDLQNVDNYLQQARESIPPRLISLRDRLKICLQAAKGIAYMHLKGLIHGSIEPGHLLVDANQTVRIRNFSHTSLSSPEFCAATGLEYKEVHGYSPYFRYSSPEKLLHGGANSVESDMYSLAMTIWSICSDEDPWDGLGLKKVELKLSKGERCAIPDSFPSELRSTITRAWSQDPKQRGTCDEIVSALESILKAYRDDALAVKQSCAAGVPLDVAAVARTVKDRVRTHLKDCTEFAWDDIRIIQRSVASGGLGVVHKGRIVSIGDLVAVKELHPHKAASEKTLTHFVMEMKTVQKLSGDQRILSMFGYSCLRDARGNITRIRMITQWMVNGSVYDYLKKARESNPPRIITLRDRVKLCLEAAKGIAFLHSQKVVHADIKPGNFLLDEDLNLHVADFGLVNLSESDISHTSSALHMAGGTAPYIAPELLDPEAPAKPTAASDIFALAVTMWSICSDQQPYAGKNQQQVIASILQKQRLAIPSDFPFELKTLIERCWNQIPVYRGNCDQVVTQLESILNALTLGASSSSSSSAPAPEGVAPFLPIALEGEDVSRGSNTHAFSLSTNASREMRLAAYDDQEHPDRIEEDSYDAD